MFTEDVDDPCNSWPHVVINGPNDHATLHEDPVAYMQMQAYQPDSNPEITCHQEEPPADPTFNPTMGPTVDPTVHFE